MLRRTVHSLATMSDTNTAIEAATSGREPPTKRPRSDEIVTDDIIFQHGREVLECDVCTMYFLSQKNLDAHLKIHRLQHDFECRICGKAYTTADGLTLHRKSAHTEPSPRIVQQGGGTAPSDEPLQVCLRRMNSSNSKF